MSGRGPKNPESWARGEPAHWAAPRAWKEAPVQALVVLFQILLQVGRCSLVLCEGSGRCLGSCPGSCLVSFDFTRRQISAGKNRKKIISLCPNGSYTTKMKCPRRPSPPLKIPGLSGQGDEAAPETLTSLSSGWAGRVTLSSQQNVGTITKRKLFILPFLCKLSPPPLP